MNTRQSQILEQLGPKKSVTIDIISKRAEYVFFKLYIVFKKDSILYSIGFFKTIIQGCENSLHKRGNKK